MSEPIQRRIEHRCQGCGETVIVPVEIDGKAVTASLNPGAFIAAEVAAFERLIAAHPYCLKCSARGEFCHKRNEAGRSCILGAGHLPGCRFAKPINYAPPSGREPGELWGSEEWVVTMVDWSTTPTDVAVKASLERAKAAGAKLGRKRRSRRREED